MIIVASKPQIGPILSKPHYWFSYSSHSKLELGRKGRNTFSVSTTEGRHELEAIRNKFGGATANFYGRATAETIP